MKQTAKIFNKVLTICIIVIMSMSIMVVPAFAVEEPIKNLGTIENIEDENSFRYSFGSTGGMVTGSGSFTLTTNGDPGLYDRISISTLSLQADPPSAIYISIMKPDGEYFKNGLFIEPDSTEEFTMFFAQSGTYTVYYIIVNGYSGVWAEINP